MEWMSWMLFLACFKVLRPSLHVHRTHRKACKQATIFQDCAHQSSATAKMEEFTRETSLVIDSLQIYVWASSPFPSDNIKLLAHSYHIHGPLFHFMFSYLPEDYVTNVLLGESSDQLAIILESERLIFTLIMNANHWDDFKYSNLFIGYKRQKQTRRTKKTERELQHLCDWTSFPVKCKCLHIMRKQRKIISYSWLHLETPAPRFDFLPAQGLPGDFLLLAADHPGSVPGYSFL